MTPLHPYERVRQSRQTTAGALPLPSPLTCIRYATLKLAEYEAALLHQEIDGRPPGDPRVHLGGCGYMLLSAMVQCPEHISPDNLNPNIGHLNDPRSLYYVLFADLVEISKELHAGKHMKLACEMMEIAWRNFTALCFRSGWDAESLIEETCTSVERAHTPWKAGNRE